MSRNWSAPSTSAWGLDIGFGQPGLDDDPPPPFDPGYWWPASEGYGNGIRQMRYAPVEAWPQMSEALRAVGMTDAEIAGGAGRQHGAGGRARSGVPESEHNSHGYASDA